MGMKLVEKLRISQPNGKVIMNFFSLLFELKKFLANFFFFKQLIEIAEILSLVTLLLSPQILIVKS